MSMSTSTHDIPNRFDFHNSAPAIYQQWLDAKCFAAKVDPNKKPYTIVIPPPNVTGALHLGHALNNTLQDIQVRMHRMMGFSALWMPGTDHAGIATQAVVEKRLKEDENKTRHDLGREKLVERIWDWKAQYEKRILGQLQRLGCSCDWDRTRFTLDEQCAKAVRRTFFDLFSKNLIYRGKRLVNWDTFLQTAVSDDEVFHAKTKGHFWHINYPVIDPQPGEPTHITIATTRPETLLGDTAVAVHPQPAKALDKAIEDAEKRLAAASDKDRPTASDHLETLRKRKSEYLPSLELFAQMAADGRQLELPLTGRTIPLIADSWAKPELGSGCVKITPAHDPNDYLVGQRCDLPMLTILNTDGTMNEEAGDYAGLTIRKTREKLVADLDEAGLLEKVEDREIEMAHSDRSKTAIEPLLADQWFVRMDTLAQSAMDAVNDGRVSILPERYAKGYLDWLAEKRDWPVGRQLWWGHQLPIWSQSFDSPVLCQQKQQSIDEMPESKTGQLSTSIQDETILHVCIADDNDVLESRMERLGFHRQEDVLDTWFSSALWPHSTLGWPDKSPDLDYFYPTSTLITSRDIITLWVARMVLMGLNNLGEVPFKQVYIHPKILDGYGETMSKSKGNGVDPLDVIEKFGPDALRFGISWLATETQDVRMPVQFECPHCETLVNQTKKNRVLGVVACDHCKKLFSTQWAQTEAERQVSKAPVVSERFEVARNFCNKLWNASRFVMLNLDGFTPQKIDRESLPLEDRWILSRLATATSEATQALQAFKYADAVRILYDFAWDDFCNYYVEIAKPRMQNESARPIVQQILAHCLDTLLRLLHPITPFVTEAIWQELARFGTARRINSDQNANPWLMLDEWPTAVETDKNMAIENQFAKFTQLVSAIREVRSRQNIPPKESVDYALHCDSANAELLQPMTEFIEALANAKCTAMNDTVTAPQICSSTQLDQMELHVDLGAFIDVAAEIERNEKIVSGLDKQIQGKENKLANENFVQRAPAEVVAQERASLAELIREKETAEKAIGNLKSSQSSNNQ
jgi:valyl-tRNA synthetase